MNKLRASFLIFLSFPAIAEGSGFFDKAAIGALGGVLLVLGWVAVSGIEKIWNMFSKPPSEAPLNLEASEVTELMRAAASGDVEATVRLISRGNDVNKTDSQGATALMFAAENGRFAIVELLLNSGASKELKSHAGYSAKQYSDGYESERHTMTSTLLKNGKPLDMGLWKRLHKECEGNEEQTKTQYIKKRTEDFLALDAQRKEKAATSQQRIEAIARENAHPANPALLEAVTSGNWSATCKLLSEGVSPLGSDSKGTSLLDLATSKGDQQIVDILNSYIKL